KFTPERNNQYLHNKTELYQEPYGSCQAAHRGLPKKHSPNPGSTNINSSLNEMLIDDLWENARTDPKYLGHPSALRGKRWNEIERGKDILVSDNDPESPAVFWLVGQINDAGFWLYADGGWNKNLNQGKPFYTHHATALLTRPDGASGRLRQLFDRAMSGALAVEDIRKSANVTTEHSILRSPPDLNGELCLKLKHRIFVPADSELDDVESQTHVEAQVTLRREDNLRVNNPASGWIAVRQEASVDNLTSSLYNLRICSSRTGPDTLRVDYASVSYIRQEARREIVPAGSNIRREARREIVPA
ncbi:hypothetical protein K435DRAFT_814545, partial [Dendrothele bispora CBS 962.96]